MAKIKIVEMDSNPICPNCKKELDTIGAKLIKAGFLSLSTTTVYSCPYCKVVLGVTNTFNG